ncbi:MAG: hypothetical protein AAF569_00840 [Pseudomonadota bacterium]
MKRIGFALSVLSLLVMVGIQLSPAWTPFFEKNGQKIEICTTQGIKTIVFDADRLPVEQEQQHQPSDHCPACLVRTADVVVPQLPNLPVPAFRPYVFSENQSLVSLSLETYTQYRPRDPPHLSA